MENLSSLKDKDPIKIFEKWWQEAKEHKEIPQADAMVLSTIVFGHTEYDVKPVSRVVLLKEITQGELIFYTNYRSAKAYQLKHESALNFYWQALGRQVRMEGMAEKIDRKKSTQYWKTRPRESQISQYISEQSKKLDSRMILEKKWQEAERKFSGKEIPCPDHWGGYSFLPDLIEFWVEKSHRLHDRLVFKKKLFYGFSKQKWKSHLLYP